MAKVQYGALVTALSGSIGGWTFHTNRSGNIVRTRGGTGKNSTSRQTIAHQSLQQFIQLWQQLSSANKTLWDAYAITWTREDRFGTVNTLSGINWFFTTNYYRDLLSLSILNSPPVHTLPVAVPSFVLNVNLAAISITFSPAFNPASNALLIFSTGFNTRTTTSQRSAMRLTRTISSGPYSLIDITSDWETAHAMSWPPPGANPCGGLGVQVQTINEDSGITSSGVINTSGIVLASSGIGVMIIESTFIVG